MGHAEFRELLEIAKEYKISAFKKGDIEVHFQVDYAPVGNPALKDLENTPDPDEEMLKKIEELKNQSLTAVF